MKSYARIVPLAAALVMPALANLELEPRQDSGACKDVHVFLARGNNEPYPGRQGSLVGAICGGLESCDYEDIQFYNPLESPYCESLNEGARNGNAQITAYNERCPDAKLVVSGYSQGAHVVGDVLGGGGGVFFQECVQNENAGLDPDTAPGNMIYAALLFGDTRHTANQPYNSESGAGNDGLFPRTGGQLAGLNRFSKVLRDFCVESDPICAGGNIVANHLNYFDIYPQEAANWVYEKLGDDSETSTTSSMATSTSVSTSTSTSTSATSTTTTTTSSEESSSTSTSQATTTSASATSASTSASATSTSAQSSSTTASETHSSTATTPSSSTSAPSETEDGGSPTQTDDDSAAIASGAPLTLLLSVGLLFCLWA